MATITIVVAIRTASALRAYQAKKSTTPDSTPSHGPRFRLTKSAHTSRGS